MFILEAYLAKRREKIDAWEDGCREWIAADRSNYSYRTKRDWERQNPYPVFRWENVAKVAIPVVVIAAIITVGLVAIIRWQPPQTKVDKANPNNCTTVVHKSDKIAVNYGDFQGSKGTVIRQNSDCSVDMTLTTSTNTFAQCKAQDSSNDCSGTESNGMVLHLDKSDNAIKL